MKTATLTSTLLHAGAAAGLYYGGVIGSSPSPIPCCMEGAVPVVWEAPSVTPAPIVTPAQAGVQEKSHSDNVLDLDPCFRRDDRGLRNDKEQKNDKVGTCSSPPFTPDPHNKPPSYPEEARERELEGHGIMRLYLTTDGRVEHTEMLTPLDPLFIREAEKVLRTWRFRGTLPAYVDVPLDFSLRTI